GAHRFLTGHSETVYGLSFSPQGDRLLSYAADKTLKIWNLENSRATTLEGHEALIRAGLFSRDGSLIASGSVDRSIRLWSATGELRAILRGHLGWINDVQFSSDGKSIASAGRDAEVRVWKLNSADQLPSFATEFESWIRGRSSFTARQLQEEK